MATSSQAPIKKQPNEGIAVIAVNTEPRRQNVMDTSPTTECASSSYEPLPGVVKPRIRRRSASRRKAGPLARRLSRLVHQFYD